MQELLFLLLLMVMTALGVRLFLSQMEGRRLLTRPGLPRLALPRLALPKLGLKRSGRKRRSRKNRRSRAEEAYDLYDEPYDEDEELDRYALPASPFIAPAAYAPAAVDILELEPELDEYEDIETLPSSQVDFFSDGNPAVKRVVLTPTPSVASPGMASSPAGAPPIPVAGEAAEAADMALLPETPEGVYVVPAASETPEAPADPNDLLAFFEKAETISQVPETLRDALEKTSAAELLAEARAVSQLIRSHRRSA